MLGLVRRVRRSLSSSRVLRKVGARMPQRSVRRTRPTEEQARKERAGGEGAAWTTDERTQRRIAEVQRGGEPSEVSAEKYARGVNPGGTHHHEHVEHEGGASPVHQRPEHEEPQEREERHPGGARHMASTRRGA